MNLDLAAENDDIIDNLFKVRLVEKIRHIGEESSTLLGDYNFTNIDYSKPWIFECRPQEWDLAIAQFLEDIVIALDNTEQYEKFSALAELKDTTGFTLVHYLCKFKLNKSLRFLMKHKIDFAARGKGGIMPGHICLWEDNYEMLDEIQSYLGESIGWEAEHINVSDFLSEGKTIEKLLKHISQEGSFKKHNAHSDKPKGMPPSVDCSSKDENESLSELIRLISSRKGVTGIDIASIAERQRFLNRKRRQRESKKRRDQSHHIGEEHITNLILNMEENYDKVKIIQKNVRCWIRRKQYLDIKYAVKVLEKCIARS